MLATVTGAAGFIGSHLVRVLLNAGYDVRALVRPGGDRRALAGLDVTIVEADLETGGDLSLALAGTDLLFHVAALYSTRPEDADRLYAVNVAGTRRLMAAALARRVARVVHTSTIGTIGRRPDGLPPDETVFFPTSGPLWEAASHYARSKIEGEATALSFVPQGLEVVVVNPCGPVGPGDWKPSANGQRIVDFLRGKLPSYLDGGINFIAVEDVAMGHLRAAERGRSGERYILGHAQGNLNRPAFLSLLHQVSGRPIPAGAAPSLLCRIRRGLRPATVQSAPDRRPIALTANPAKAIRELNLPQTPLAEAFRSAVQWFLANGYVS